MRPGRWVVFATYAAAIFLSLPYTPALDAWWRARFGPFATVAAAGAALAVAAVAMGRRLRRARATFPRPHLALAAILAAGWAAWALLASSPIGRVHLPQYGLLAALASRAIGGAPAAAVGGGAVAAGIGLLDEAVQGVTPGRVFDWWDVALNAAAAAIGGLAWAWWRWTGRGEP